MQKMEDVFKDFSEKNNDTELSKIVFFIIGKIYEDIKIALDYDKISRDDVAEYKIKVMQRQQIINERLISFGGIEEGNCVLDACCGPEGSSLAVVRKGAKWYGNEISKKTYEHLLNMGLNVKNGTAENLPFKESMFDYTIYCYAINNIQATLKTFNESNRVLKNKGNMLIADPGITVWLSDIILFSIKENIKNKNLDFKKIFKNSKKFNNKIPKYFEDKSVNSNDYTDVLINGLLGINKNILINNFSEIVEYLINRYTKNNKSIDITRLQNYFHKYINALYWENIMISSKIIGMDLDKCNFYNCFKNNENDEWNFTNLLEIDLKNKKGFELRDIFMKLQLPKEEYSEELLIGKKGIQSLLPTIMFNFKKQ